MVCGVSVIIFALHKTVHVNRTRFSTDTDAMVVLG